MKDTNISLSRLNPMPPKTLVMSAEISDDIDQQKAANRAKK